MLPSNRVIWQWRIRVNLAAMATCWRQPRNGDGMRKPACDCRSDASIP